VGVAKKNFLGVVSCLPRVINSRFNLSASLLLLQYRVASLTFQFPWKVSCSRRALRQPCFPRGTWSSHVQDSRDLYHLVSLLKPHFSDIRDECGSWSARFVTDQWPGGCGPRRRPDRSLSLEVKRIFAKRYKKVF